MAEAFVKTFKRDYVRVNPIPKAESALAAIEEWMDDYNVHPRSRLGYRHRGSFSEPMSDPPLVRFDGELFSCASIRAEIAHAERR
jgi:putative transposase